MLIMLTIQSVTNNIKTLPKPLTAQHLEVDSHAVHKEGAASYRNILINIKFSNKIINIIQKGGKI